MSIFHIQKHNSYLISVRQESIMPFTIKCHYSNLMKGESVIGVRLLPWVNRGRQGSQQNVSSTSVVTAKY